MIWEGWQARIVEGLKLPTLGVGSLGTVGDALSRIDAKSRKRVVFSNYRGGFLREIVQISDQECLELLSVRLD